MRVRRWSALLMALICAMLPPLHASPAADPNKVLRWAFEIAETGFDPAQTSDWYSNYVFANIFDTPLT